jgi:NTE family protein
VGYVRGTGRATRRIGDPLFPDLKADIGGLQAAFWVDQLDNVNAPKEGYFAQVVLAAQRRGLGATESYDRLDGTVVGVRTLGRFTGLVRLSGGDGLGTRLPFYDQFTLGGLFNLSGLPRNQLLGETYGFAGAILLYRLNDTPGFLIRGLYVGTSVEAGNVWRTRSEASLSNLKNAGSVFLSADTLIGPAFLAYGRASGGSHAYYFYLSRLF